MNDIGALRGFAAMMSGRAVPFRDGSKILQRLRLRPAAEQPKKGETTRKGRAFPLIIGAKPRWTTVAVYDGSPPRTRKPRAHARGCMLSLATRALRLHCSEAYALPVDFP